MLWSAHQPLAHGATRYMLYGHLPLAKLSTQIKINIAITIIYEHRIRIPMIFYIELNQSVTEQNTRIRNPMIKIIFLEVLCAVKMLKIIVFYMAPNTGKHSEDRH